MPRFKPAEYGLQFLAVDLSAQLRCLSSYLSFRTHCVAATSSGVPGGFSQTRSGACQARVPPDQRCGFLSRAAA